MHGKDLFSSKVQSPQKEKKHFLSAPDSPLLFLPPAALHQQIHIMEAPPRTPVL